MRRMDNRLVKQQIMLARNDKWYKITRKISKKWSDEISDWCGSSLPEAFHLALIRDKWNARIKEITGINVRAVRNKEEGVCAMQQ